MGRLSQFAIGITELRDMFGAEPELASRLRQIAAADFPAPADPHGRRRKLLGRVGPAMKRPIDPPTVPHRPAPPDVEALLTAHAIGPERQGYAWQIVLAWLGELSWGRLDLDVDEREMSDLEFDLATAGLPSQFALEKLLQGDPQIPLFPCQGSVGDTPNMPMCSPPGRPSTRSPTAWTPRPPPRCVPSGSSWTTTPPGRTRRSSRGARPQIWS